MVYTWWLIAALVLAIGEMFTIGFLLGCLCIGALGGALASYLGAGLSIQMLSFTVSGVGAGILLRPLARKFFHRPGTVVETNAAALISQSAIILEPPDPVTGIGRVLVAGENWRARLKAGADPASLADKGSRATVVGIEGATVIIEPANPASIPPHADSQLSY
jgi:membrane protein implicated in regulation of membrane protease activity